jgi:NADH-quinone oxidoreductase subunit L
MLVWATALIPIAGVILGWLIYGRNAVGLPKALDTSRTGSFLRSGWGFDRLYDLILVKPFDRLAIACKDEPIDGVYNAIVAISRGLNKAITATQTGKIRWYAANMGIGLALVLALAVIVL